MTNVGKNVALHRGALIDSRLAPPGDNATDVITVQSANCSSIRIAKTLTPTITTVDIAHVHDLFTFKAPGVLSANDAYGPLLIERMILSVTANMDGGASSAGKPSTLRFRAGVYSTTFAYYPDSGLPFADGTMIDVAWDCATGFSSVPVPGRWTMKNSGEVFTSPYYADPVPTPPAKYIRRLADETPPGVAREIYWPYGEDLHVMLRHNMTRASGSSAVDIRVSLTVDVRTYAL